MNKKLLYAVSTGVFLIYVFGAIVSFAGLYGIAPWLKMPPVVYWSFPLAVDLAIILYKVAEVVQKRNDVPSRKVRKAIFGSLAFTAVSSIGNVIHVANDPDPSSLRLWGGIFFAGLMPWAVYLSASVLTDLIVQPARASAEVPAQEELGSRAMREELEEWDREDFRDSHTDATLVFRQGDEEAKVGDPVETYPVVVPTSADVPPGGFSLVKDIRPFPSAWGGGGDGRD